MKCPNCKKEIDNKEIARHFASIGGKKYSQSLTKEQRIERARKAGKNRWKNKKTST